MAVDTRVADVGGNATVTLHSPNYRVRTLTCPVPNRNDVEIMNKSHQAVERRGRVAQSTVLPRSEENWEQRVALFATLALGDVPAARICAPPAIRRSGAICYRTGAREGTIRARKTVAGGGKPPGTLQVIEQELWGSAIRHCRGRARQGHCVIEHCRDTVGLGTAGTRYHGHCRNTVQLGAARLLCG